jgi:predicted phosphoribosyltransferase
MADLVDRLLKRSEDDQACAENSMAVFEALGEHYRAFDQRSGRWNTYAVRMAVDHKKGAERDAQHAADLREVVSEISRLREENERIRNEAREAYRAAIDRSNRATDAEIDEAIRALKAEEPRG